MSQFFFFFFSFFPVVVFVVVFRINLGFWETAHLPLPSANINTYFSLKAKWWLREGVGEQFPRNQDWSIFLANVYFVYSSLASTIQCSLVFVSFLSSLLFIADDRSCNLVINTYNDISKDFWYWHYYWHSLWAVPFLFSCVLPGAIRKK